MAFTQRASSAVEREAEAKARELWANNAERRDFQFEDSGIDGVTVQEVLS